MVECEFVHHVVMCQTAQRFNRYMVECECLPVEELIEYRDGFNRYMVECEFRFRPQGCLMHCILIDTWWNVNTIILVVPVSASGF